MYTRGSEKTKKAHLTWLHMTEEGVIHRLHCRSKPNLATSIAIDTRIIERLIRKNKLISLDEEQAHLDVPIKICRVCLEEFLRGILTIRETRIPTVASRYCPGSSSGSILE